MSKDRFVSPRLEECPRQHVVKTDLVTPYASLDARYTMAQMIPNALGAIDLQGRFVDLRDKLRIPDPQLRQLTVITMAPWGEVDMMIIDTHESRPAAFHDVPESVQRTSFSHQALIAKSIQEMKGVVYWGENFSAGSLKKNKGLQSVLSAHAHVFGFSDAQADLTNEEIADIRDSQLWDEGISRVLGEQIARRVTSEVLPLYRPGTVKADAMGYMFDLPGFRTEDLGDPSFVSKFLKPISLINLEALRGLHSEIYKSDLLDVLNYVQSRKHQNDVDDIYYASMFERVPLQKDAPPYVRKLHELYDLGLLREPAGWAIGIRIDKKGAKGGVTIGALNEGLGPVETLAVKLFRPEKPVSLEEMRRRKTFYESCIERQVQVQLVA